jgi:hypothetical protein
VGDGKVWNSGRNDIIGSSLVTCVSKTESENDIDVPVEDDQGYNSRVQLQFSTSTL